ncbi:ankyrin repeat and KH domain-containing protein 1-like [Formica exsecta]|uniref:ankyrin repeat and KH domain-containing protein 1-like n=1 Tax=Formica exsecta TaxID=72781 RepID=UPI0011429903|nr:ankyrin repeat and KH domain-containing protein 1-like [Formica exsecta]
MEAMEELLNLACCKGYLDAVELALKRGANIECATLGYTPLMEAALNGHEKVVKLLVDHDANINAQSEETFETALSLACCGGFLQIVIYLIKKGTDIKLDGSISIIRAAQKGHLKLLQQLLVYKANIHAEIQTGDTALTLACENGHTKIVDLLLQHGANPEHESKEGRTPLMIATRAGHLDIIRRLLSKGAVVRNGQSLLCLAFTGGHYHIIKYLRHKLTQPQTQPQQSYQQPHSQQQTSQQQSHHNTIQQQQQQQQYLQPPIIQQISMQTFPTVNQATGITDSISLHQSTSYAQCTAYQNQVATQIGTVAHQSTSYAQYTANQDQVAIQTEPVAHQSTSYAQYTANQDQVAIQTEPVAHQSTSYAQYTANQDQVAIQTEPVATDVMFQQQSRQQQ